MKALVLSGFVWGTEDETRLSRELMGRLAKQGYSTEQVDLMGLELADCRACFGCWNVTPGECCRRDTAGQLAGKAIGADLMVLLTSVRFGSFSAPLKKVVDRMIGIVMPFFCKQGAVSHHLPRYERTPGLLGVGVGDPAHPAWDRTFEALIGRLAVDFHSPSSVSVTFGPAASAEEIGRRLDIAVRQAGGAS